MSSCTGNQLAPYPPPPSSYTGNLLPTYWHPTGNLLVPYPPPPCSYTGNLLWQPTGTLPTFSAVSDDKLWLSVPQIVAFRRAVSSKLHDTLHDTCTMVYSICTHRHKECLYLLSTAMASLLRQSFASSGCYTHNNIQVLPY
jgi:hypothetical protein